MKKTILLSLFAFALMTVSCKKDASEFQGKVRYIDSLGAYHVADSVVITFHDKDTSAPVALTTYTDGEGIYLISDVPDGIWVLKAQLAIDSNTVYSGFTEKLECKGKDFIAAPIDMEQQ